MSATIKDIARETGLSLSTISKYLNNKSIQEQNKLLIEEAIRKLDYRPNRIAQSLRSERTMTVAVLLPDSGETLSILSPAFLRSWIILSSSALIIMTVRQKGRC